MYFCWSKNAGRFAGRRFDLASDELTGNDAVAILSRITGRSFAYYQIPLEVSRQDVRMVRPRRFCCGLPRAPP